MLEYQIEIVELMNNRSDSQLGSHTFEFVRIDDPDIFGVRAYEDHDEILAVGTPEDPKVYCLTTFTGLGSAKGMPHKFIADYNGRDLEDLSMRSQSVLPFSTLENVSKLMGQLRDENKLKRNPAKCGATIRLEKILIAERQQP